jgi:hypothetical protein
MISCDTCEVWFHGKCVGITKDLSKQIEEWNCPPCKKKKTKEARKKSDEEKTNKKLNEDKRKKYGSIWLVKKTDSKSTKIQPLLQQNCVQRKKVFEGIAMGLYFITYIVGC